MRKRRFVIDPDLAKEAKSIVAHAFRNGPIEDIHAGIDWPMCAASRQWAAAKQSAFGIIAGQEFDRAEPIIFLLPVHTFNSLNPHFPEFLADTCDERDSRSAQIRRSYRPHRTTDYATVLFPLPGLSNDLEVVRLL